MGTTEELLARQHYVEDFPFAELKPHPKNPRLHDIASIEESIETNTFAGAIYAQEGTNIVLSGHGRLNVLIAKGVTNGPVIFIECDDNTAEKLMLAFNRVGEKSEYNVDLLTEMLAQRAEVGDLLGTGYDADALDDLLSEMDGVFETGEQEFTGDYAEPPEHTQARSERRAETKLSRGLREMVCVYDSEKYAEVSEAIRVIEEFHDTNDTASSVAIGLIEYAKSLEADNDE
jgi:hypothetical protein